jgi:hypothetical protein
MTDIEFTIRAKAGDSVRRVPIQRAVIAGWTGRDPVARDKHIRELEELGVKPPAMTPIFYRIAAARITAATTIQVTGETSSGEVEFVLVKTEGQIFVGVGSDHTDREVETYGVTVSKQMCDKPVAPELWPFAEVENHWDRLILRSWASFEGRRELYQEGAVAGMLPVSELLTKGFGAGGMPDGTAMFGGTFAAKGGIRPSSRFEYELEDPVLGRTIRSGYEVETLPVLG